MLNLNNIKVREIIVAWLIVAVLNLALVTYESLEHESTIRQEQTARYYAA